MAQPLNANENETGTGVRMGLPSEYANGWSTIAYAIVRLVRRVFSWCCSSVAVYFWLDKL